MNDIDNENKLIFTDGYDEDEMKYKIYYEFLKFMDECENNRVPPYQCRTGCKHYRKDEITWREYCVLSNKIKYCELCGDYELN